MKYIIFSYDGIGFPIAKKLIDEGAEVTVAQINDPDTLETGAEDSDKEARDRRLSAYDGILDKLPAEKVIKAMAKMENKDDYFILFDFNNLWKYAEMALEMGFTKGMFPTKEDWELEQQRNTGKKIVERYYPNLKVAEVEEFKSVDDAIEFLDGAMDCYVLKGDSDDCPTVVPHTNDPEFAKQLIIDSLEAHKTEYEGAGFILEKKIPNVLEFTPEMFWWDGEPIATSVDFETKNFGPGDVNGVQVGCGLSLVVKTNLEDEINQIAFPKWVHQRAKKRKGLFVWDASILYQPEEQAYYFGEFCANRFGFDSLFAEIAMAGSTTEFFEDIAEGENPFKKNFGSTVRGMNQHKHGVDEGGRVLKGVKLMWKPEMEKDIWLYDVMKDEKDSFVTCGQSWDLVAFTGASNDAVYSVERAYETKEGFCMDGMYCRSKQDFLSREYETSIFKRYDAFNGKLFNQEKIEL